MTVTVADASKSVHIKITMTVIMIFKHNDPHRAFLGEDAHGRDDHGHASKSKETLLLNSKYEQ
jgi:hypothetical protein